MAVVSDPAADERSVNEVFGFVGRLYLQAAQQQAEYVVSLGVASLMGGARTTELIDMAERAGYLHRGEDEQGRSVLRLLDDPEFIHIRTAAELQWEKQRKADNSNVHLVLPVRLRDGDACRSCSRIVRFGNRDHRSKLAGTYDHRIPGEPCRSPEDMVVLCRGCNGGRRDAEGRRDELFPLLPPPEKPYWHKSTVSWLREPEHKRVLEDLGMRPPAAIAASVRDRRAGTELRKVELEQLRKTGTSQVSGTAAAHTSASQRPEPGPLGDVDAASREERMPASAPRDAELQRPEGAHEDPGSATWHASQGPRPERTSAPSVTADQRHPEFRPASPPPDSPPLTRENATCRSRQITRLQELDIPGRDGSGRAGPARDGQGQDGGRPQGAAPPGPGGSSRRRKRGRRRGKR
ncbi:hypothetical protein BRM3_08990 [Brachybacterium huguangmaarense]|uniref:HNH endonuclease n=1 Tax=Brachybacterium huguangmaarense TaxID=1652028 RepID=A0ABY6FY68_9MICO|nr:hypothetical protein [Brachybacterium huguangmaarense]UYG15780.1 hypothetical protein BRM3_08990 [Brachybacterium huguangmaarense]